MNSGRIHVRRPHGLMDVLRRGNLGALILPLILLGAGAVARGRLARKTVTFSWHGVQLAHPTGWTVAERSADSAEGDEVVLVDLLGPGRIKPRVTLRIAPVPAPPSDADEAEDTNEKAEDAENAAGNRDGVEARPADEPAADASAREVVADAPPSGPAIANAPAVPPAAAAVALSNQLPLYYVMGQQSVQIGDVPATRIESAFAFTPRSPPGRKVILGRKGDIPVVMRAIDLVLLQGKDALSVQVAAPIEDFENQRPTLEAIIGSLRLDAATAAAAHVTAEPPGAVAVPASPQEPDAAAAVVVAGQVLDAESGLPVPGAIVLFLAPGTSIDDVNDDNLAQIAYTTGLADSAGHFASNRALERPGHYGVMVVADGYSWVGNDEGVALEAETPPRLDVGAVRLRRR